MGKAAGIGASVAITDYKVNNIAAIADNDSDAVRADDDEVANLGILLHGTLAMDAEEKAALFGTKASQLNDVVISAHKLNVTALNDSVINTVTVAGGVVTGDDSDTPGIGDKFSNFVSNTKNKVQNKFNVLDNAINTKLTGEMNTPGVLKTDQGASNPSAGQKLPSFTVAGAGSASVNLVAGKTAAVIDGANVKLHQATVDEAAKAGAVNVQAVDDSFIGAWGGAAGISWKNTTTEQNWSNKSVGLAGAVAVNETDTGVVSLIKDSTINEAGSISNVAKKSGALVAAGLGIAVAKSGEGGGKNYTGAASVSVNLGDNTVHAIMDGNTVNDVENSPTGGKTVLTNSAYDNDTQVTGGINASLALGGDKGVALGGTVTVATLTNDVKAQIKGGNYKKIGTADVSAITDITQVGAAVGVSVTTSGSAGSSGNYGFEGVAAYNQLNNTAAASVDNAVLTVDKINVAAKDSDMGEKTYDKYINKRGLDATGATYLDNVSDTADDNLRGEDGKLRVGQTGNTIVTAALGITGSNGSSGGSASAAASISDINNDFTSAINGSTITAGGLANDTSADVNVSAKTDTLLVGAAAGVGASSKSFGGAASLIWQTLDNDTTATVENSNITSAATAVNAVNGALAVDVAGQVSVGKTALGLAIAYNKIANNTGAYLKGSTLQAASDDDSIDVSVEAENGSKIYTVGAGVGASKDNAAANGTIAINRGRNNTEAIVDKSAANSKTTLKQVKKLVVAAQDQNQQFALVGSISGAKTAAIGGAVAYNEVGDISGTVDRKQQKATAQINNTDVEAAAAADIKTTANDASKLTTIAVGVGIAKKGAAVEGAATTALINKKVEASMTGTKITTPKSNAAKATVAVSADSTAQTVSSASVLAATTGGAAIGAGVAVNKSEADVDAFVSGGEQQIKDLSVQAASKATIETIGIGGGVVGGTGAAITGSIAVNMLDNDVTAKIRDGAKITAENNAVVSAASDELISNYAGSATVAVQGAAIGASVSVNQIDGSTDAVISGSKTSVTAKGKNTAAVVKDTVADNKILDNFVDNDAFEAQSSLADARTASSYKGVAVSASSTHTIKSFLINASVAGKGAAVSGTVNVNKVGGKTTAAITEAAINPGGSTAGGYADLSDVNVIAHDYTNTAGIVGGVSVAGVGAGVGLGSDTSTLARTTAAKISGDAGKNIVAAKALNVQADAKQGISSLITSVSVAGVGAGVSNATGVALMESTTTATISKANVTAESLSVSAEHTGKINTLGIAVGAGGPGAGVGLGVSVVNEKSDTEAAVSDTDVVYTSEAGTTAISADNKTKVNYQLYNLGGAAVGVAGSVGVANVNSTVRTDVTNTNLGSKTANKDNKTGTISISSANDIDFTQKAGTGAAGAVGIGVGVTVNTIDSQVATTVENSRLNARNKIDVTAAEKRAVEQLAVNAAAGASIGVGANVMVTNIGKEVASAYGDDSKGAKVNNIDTIYKEANAAVGKNKLSSSYTMGGISSDEESAVNGNISAGKGAGEDINKSMVKTKIDGATLQAGGVVNVASTETTDITMNGINAQVGGAASVSGAVGILDVHGNSGVEITSGIINADSLNIAARQKGNSALNIYQGTLSGAAAIGAAYGSVTSEGKTGVGIGNSSLTTNKDIVVAADDSGSTKVNAIGVAVAGVAAASVIVAEGSNSSTTSITVDQSELDAQGNVDISAERQAKDDNGKVKAASLEVSAIAASGGLSFAGAGVSAQATEQGTVTIGVTSSAAKKTALTAGKTINIEALNAPSVKAVTGAVSASMIASAAVTVGQARIGSASKHLVTSVNIGDGNILSAGSDDKIGTINIKASTNAKQDVAMQALSISASPFPSGSAQVNTGGADIYSDVDVTAGINTYRGKDLDSGEDGTVDLTLEGSNSVTQKVRASGISAGTVFATGTNLANSTAHLTTNVTAAGSTVDSRLDDLTVQAKSYAQIDNEANGYGGAFIDISPFAAKVANDYTAQTTAVVNGNWLTAGSVAVQAVNGSDLDLQSDAVRAAIIGGSGVWLNNSVNDAAVVNIEDAVINSEGAQQYTAQNNIDYNGTIDGSGYGGLNVNATDFKDDFDFTAGVKIVDSTLQGLGDSGSITAQALTQGSINSRNGLKSAGVIPISLAFSDHDINYAHQVDVDKSTLKTAKKDQNITLAASDDTDVKLETIADTQGGVIGAASANADNELHRANKIAVGVGSVLESTNDVNLYAGANSGGIDSSLDLEVLADAYNKTLLPLYTKPRVNNIMRQYNQVDIAGSANSVRHINVKAGKGMTTVTKSAREYNIYTGIGGSGSVAATALGENIGDEKSENYLNVTGTAKSGIHNKLDVSIGGAITTTAPTYDANNKMTKPGSISYDGITITVNEGSDWFDKNSITPAGMIIANGLRQRYFEVTKLLLDYNINSSEYKGYQTELQNIILEMKQANMVARDKNGNQTDVPLKELNVPAISLPAIVVSGGDINIEADVLKGAGSLTAQGAPQLTITNNSDLYLAVGDLTIKDAGGQLKFNDSALKSSSTGNEFKGKTKADGLDTGITPTITVQSGSPSSFTNNPSPQADIGVFGNISNTAGDIKISNDNYNILVKGNVSGRNITLAADTGSVTQTSSEGLVNIGGDPVTRYQFSDGVAKKIQNYFYQNPEVGSKSFANYDDYKNWLISTVGISADELNYQADESAGILAGDNVYISGLNVNVGGLVQSGYGNYTTTLNETDAGKVKNLDEQWAANQRLLSDNEVMTNNAYCINDGGKKWNSATKVWDYEVKVYYNPSTKQLLTDSIAPNGGKIYITGKVSSTGNGRLMAMDGAANIGIDTSAVARDVRVNTITNNDISGLVSLTDKNTGKVTEYMNGQTRSYAVGAVAGAWGSGDSSYTYAPQKNLQYQWTGGASGETTKKYSYSEDFLFWGLLDYGQTADFVAGLKRDGKEYTYTTSSGAGQNLATGSVINTGSGGDQLKINASHWTTNDETYTSVVADKQYDGTAGKIFGYGTTYYYWTGKQGTASATTSSLKADYGISVGFLGNGSGNGDIKVTSQNDMLLAGNIANATVIKDSKYAGMGNVTLNSQTGSVTSVGNAKISSDEVNIQAATGIEVNHAAIGDSAVVDVATNSGNISFLSDKGNLQIKKMVTGGNNAITAETGNVYLQADGSILNAAASGYVVKGQRIDLVSNTGSIGTKDKALTVLGGSELFSSDSMTSSINAAADDDIVLTQTEGNMRLGTLESTNGDAVLTVGDGSFVDAYNAESTGLSDSADKVERWLDSGLISKDDSADSSDKAAELAKSERLDGLDARAAALAENNSSKVEGYKNAAESLAADDGLQAAKATYTQAVQNAAGTSDADAKKQAIDKAYTTYQEAQQKYFADKGYSDAEQELITAYAEVKNSDNYGWSKNQLLYAIQDSVINSAPGQVQTVAKANVSAQNIALYAEYGAVGIDGAAKEIGYNDLAQLANLKLLAASKAGDLTWDDAKQTVTVRQQQAINLQSKNQGQIKVTGRDNVYLAGTKNTEFNITGISTLNDIKLMSDNGVNMIGAGVLQGVNLIINGGAGSVGSATKHLVTNISGTLDANSGKSVYIKQTGQVLNIQAVAAGDDVVLSSAEGMVGSTAAGKNTGYINAGNTITLDAAAGSIGAVNDGIRILNNGSVVNVSAKNSIYISGRNAGDMVLGQVTAGDTFYLESAGNVNMGRAQEVDDKQVITTAVNGVVQVQNDGTISAVNINLDNGGITVTDADSKLLLQATDSITQSKESAGIKAEALHTRSSGQQKLLSVQNNVKTWTADSLNADKSITGGVEFVGNSAAGLQAILNELQVNDGNVSINNIADNADLTVTGSVNVAGNNKASGDIDFSSRQDVLNNASLTNSGTATIAGGRNLMNTSSINSGKDVKLTAGKNIQNTGVASEIKAANDVQMTATSGDVENKAKVIATAGNVKLKAGAAITNAVVNANKAITMTADKGNITNNGAIDAGTELTLTATKGSIENKANVTANAGAIMMTADVDVTNDADVVTHNGETNGITMTATKGSIANKANVTADVGAIMMTAGKNIQNTGAASEIKAANDVQMTATSGDVENKAKVIATAGNVKLKAGAAITNAVVNANKAITMTADKGNITNNGAIDAGADLALTATKGSIENKDKVTANSGSITLTADVDVTNDADVVTNNGETNGITMTATKGSIENKANVTANAGTIKLTAGKNIQNTGAAINAFKNVEMTANGGSITNNSSVISGSDSDVIMKAAAVTGDVTNTNTINSGKSTALTAGHDIDNSGAVTSVTAITMTAGNDLSNAGLLTAKQQDIALEATGGNLTIKEGGTVVAELGDIALTTKNATAAATEKGKITVNAELHARENINLTVDRGDVMLAADADVQNGTLKIAVENGAIKSTHSDAADGQTAGVGVQLSSINGNVDIYTKHGDVDLHEIYAKNKAAAGTEAGRLQLCKIDGDIVALVTKDMNTDMNVKEIVAGSRIILSGNRIDLDDIQQRENADGLLMISPQSGDPNEPIEKFTIKNIDTSNGIRFDKLWVKNSEINVNNGRFYIDKLAVADVAHFSNGDTHTAVYGTPPQRGDSDSIYWFNYAANGPKHDLAGWHQDGNLGRWMNLYFTDRYHTQISNGVLVSLKDFYYAYDQRATGENHLQQLLQQELPHELYAENYHPDISLYQRFGLYDLPELQTGVGIERPTDEAKIIISEEV